MTAVIRVLIHCYQDVAAQVTHVYRNGAEALRPDRTLHTKNPPHLRIDPAH
jgi:chorismate mutase